MQNALVLVFFLSGIAALTFEALWFRLAGLSLGNSVWSASLVLAAFMGGLTLGNGLVARLHSRITRPIRLYAILELAIGVGGFAVVAALPRLTSLFETLFTSVANTPWLVNATRLGIAFAFLVLPTTAMGATLPVLTDALSRSNANFGANLGRLYGWNTLGSMLGAIATETLLVRLFGIAGTGLIAMTLNLAAAFFALRLAKVEPAVALTSVAGHPAVLTVRTYRYLIVGLLSGAVMLALEVVWFRFLLLTYTGTALTFAVMLTVVLGGIGLGGLAAGRLAQRDEHSYRWLPHITAASGAFVVVTYYGFDLFTTAQMQESATLPVFVAFAVFLMLPVSLLSGAAFTMVARAVKDDLGPSMRTAGTAALWNTIGAMAGSLCAGFVLLPALGMERSLFLLAVVYALTALVVPKVVSAEQKLVTRTGIATLVVTAVCLALFPFGLMERSYFKIIERGLPGENLIATREGLMETMRYYRRDLFGAPLRYRLVTNGYSMSGTALIAKRYMKLYVYLPLALRSESRDALADQLRRRLDGEGADRFGRPAPHRRRGHLARNSRDELRHLPRRRESAARPARRGARGGRQVLPRHDHAEVRPDHVRAAAAQGGRRRESVFAGVLRVDPRTPQSRRLHELLVACASTRAARHPGDHQGVLCRVCRLLAVGGRRPRMDAARLERC